MTNVYVKILQDARQLPDSYRVMGTPLKTYTSSDGGTTVTGWNICQFLYKMNEDGRDWWSNDFNIFVDESGQLWELRLGEEYHEYDGGRKSYVNLHSVDGEQLRTWHVNNWDFAKMKRSIEAMV